MEPDTLLAPGNDVVAKNLQGEFVLLQMNSGTYYGLNAVGGRVWEIISEKPRPASEIIDSIAAEFDASRPLIEQDISDLIADLKANGLVELRSA